MKVLLIDGMNLIHRARSGFMKGENALIFSFFRGLKPIVEKHSPDKVYFVLEGKPKHRKELHADYKASRPKAPDGFWPQVNKIISLMTKVPVVQIRHPDHECDDVIANLARYHSEQGNNVVIVSNDTDFIQVFDTMDSALVSIYNPHKKKFVDPPDFNYLQWKSLRGDSSDNIPGLKGVGDKTATKLINNPTLMNEVLDKGNNRERYETNLQLIGFHWFDKCDKDLVEEGAQVIYPTARFDELKEAFAEMKFKSMINEKYWANFTGVFQNITARLIV